MNRLRTILLLCALCGLASLRCAGLTTAERDRFQFEANQPKLPTFNVQRSTFNASPFDFPRVVDPEAEVIAPPPVPLPVVTNRITLEWFQPGTCYGWRVEQSTNLVAWVQIGTVFNEYIRHDSDETFTCTNTLNPVYFRVGAFNR